MGRQVCHTLGDRFEIWGAFRGEPRELERCNFISQEMADALVQAMSDGQMVDDAARNNLELGNCSAIRGFNKFLL